MPQSVNRRSFLKWSAITGAGMVASSCENDPVETIIPLLNPPYDLEIGTTIEFASVCQECPANCGIIVHTRDGRAIKIEGNPLNPLNQGAICGRGHAALQGLYNPLRHKVAFQKSGNAHKNLPWSELFTTLKNKIATFKANRILYLGRPHSGTIRKLISECITGNGWDYQTVSINPFGGQLQANQICFNKREIPHYDFSGVDTIINFGTGFLENWIQPMYFHRMYSKFRSQEGNYKQQMIHISSRQNLTACNADRWMKCQPGDEVKIAYALVKRLVAEHEIQGGKIQIAKEWLDRFKLENDSARLNIKNEILVELIQKIKNSVRPLFLSGGMVNGFEGAGALHVLVNILNWIQRNINRNIQFGANYFTGFQNADELKSVIHSIREDRYDLVFVDNIDLLYYFPQLKSTFQTDSKRPFLVSLTNETDQTSHWADILIPLAHPLESWGDAIPRKGTRLLQQPVMSKIPGYDSISRGDFILKLMAVLKPDSKVENSFQTYLKNEWTKPALDKNQDRINSQWVHSLQKGGIYADFKKEPVRLKGPQAESFQLNNKKSEGLKLLLTNSPFFDTSGKLSNHAWLMEIPDPITQITWGNWAEIHPTTAQKNNIRHGDVVEIKGSQGSLKLPVWLFSGIVEDCIAIPMGYGKQIPFPGYKSRKRKFPFFPVLESEKDIKISAETVGENVFRLSPLQTDRITGDFIFYQEGINLVKTNEKADWATQNRGMSDKRQPDFTQKKRKIHQSVQAAELIESGRRLSNKEIPPVQTTFYHSLQNNTNKRRLQSDKPVADYFSKEKWEMVIDLNKCTGCSACVVSCFTENNIPPVGKERIKNGRGMHWLQINRFIEFDSKADQPKVKFLPQMCAQCDNAGCEPVCPVLATYQTPDGLNAMIYNRCVGTRYCANNCIYKQRRFNWRTYVFPYPLNIQLNPSVSVRSKGIMEKCTFCYQRIRTAKEKAKLEGRKIKDHQVRTACQQSCPSNAITFGNILDPGSEINRVKKENKRAYHLFEQQNFQPAVTYLKRIQF